MFLTQEKGMYVPTGPTTMPLLHLMLFHCHHSTCNPPTTHLDLAARAVVHVGNHLNCRGLAAGKIGQADSPLVS